MQIKNLSAELGLDRAFVLELLRDPPANILLVSSSLPDKITETQNEPEPEPEIKMETVEISPAAEIHVAKREPEIKEPVHVMQTRWFMQKRLKKVQVETLERVYLRTKRPTVSIIMLFQERHQAQQQSAHPMPWKSIFHANF